MLKKSKKGFTLIELLVVIAIIALLASIVLVWLVNTRAQARDAKRFGEAGTLRTALELHYDDYGKYPVATNWIKIEEDTDASGPFSQVMKPYFSQIPRDPLYPKTEDEKVFSYQYESTKDEQGYKIHIEMETGEYASYEVYTGGGGEIVYGGGAGGPVGPSICQNPPGYALKFADGVDDKVLITASPSLDVTDTTGLTLEAWVKLDALDSLDYIIDKCGNEQGGYCWAVEPNNPQTGEYCPTIQFGGDIAGQGMWLVWSTSCQTAPVPGEWTHLALTYSPTHHIIAYKNGEIIDEGDIGNGTYQILPSLTKDLGIGDFINGIIDEVRIYGKALPSDLITAHCTGDFSGDSTGCDGDCDLRGLWHFDEGFGTTTSDVSGNGNNGTLINNPQWVSVP